MARVNVPRKAEPRYTHGGSAASHINAEQELMRSVMACMLWEDEFYEDGQTISNRIKDTMLQVKPVRVLDIALTARSDMNLRHVPLLLARESARIPTHRFVVADMLEGIIQRPDELAEFLAIYWKDGKEPLSAQVKKGLARAFVKFNEYQLAKYNRDNEIKLRDVLFLCHAKPKDKAQATLFRKLVDNTLATPDTWEVELSNAKVSKKDSWERLLRENKLGAMALLRNLRNMTQARVDPVLVVNALSRMKTERVLPFRFVSAAMHAPEFESAIEGAWLSCLAQQPKLSGKTIIIVDVSGSMYGSRLSAKSEMDRAKAASSLAAMARELCEEPIIFATAGNDGTRVHATVLIPNRHGFALAEAIHSKCHPLGGGGIFLKQVMDFVGAKVGMAHRVIVITDEQDCDHPGTGSPDKALLLGKYNYIINVGSNKNGIAYGKWTHITGWSDAVLKYIALSEKAQ